MEREGVKERGREDRCGEGGSKELGTFQGMRCVKGGLHLATGTHRSYLRGCRGQFLQPHKVPLLHLHDLLPLHGEEPLEGGDELKVGGGCHVVVSAEFGQEPGQAGRERRCTQLEEALTLLCQHVWVQCSCTSLRCVLSTRESACI